MLVWYPGKKPRETGLRLEPGWNALPQDVARELIGRGVVLQQEPERTDERPDEPEGA